MRFYIQNRKRLQANKRPMSSDDIILFQTPVMKNNTVHQSKYFMIHEHTNHQKIEAAEGAEFNGGNRVAAQVPVEHKNNLSLS